MYILAYYHGQRVHDTFEGDIASVSGSPRENALWVLVRQRIETNDYTIELTGLRGE